MTPMWPILITPATSLPVTLEEVKKAANVDFPDDDALLENYLKAAFRYLNGWHGILGHSIVNETYKIEVEEPFGHKITIPFHDVIDIVITWEDGDSNVQTLPPEHYKVVPTATGTELRFIGAGDLSFPLTITFITGFGDKAEDVPPPIKVAIMMLAVYWYEHREAASDIVQNKLPFAVDALLAPYRRIHV